MKRLIKEGLIAESSERPARELDDARRRYYKLTALGQRVLDLESDRLKQLVRILQTKRNRRRDHSLWMSNCQRVYRSLARAFPYEFRMICGDGLERLGEDMVPRVWQQWGAVGMVRLLADVALRLPYEYFSTWFAKLTEVTMPADLLEGTWKGNKREIQVGSFNYTPEEAYLRFEATETGYVLFAYGIKDGQAVAERPRPLGIPGWQAPAL